MEPTGTISNPSTRSTRSSVSAVIIVGLLIGVAVSSFKPGLRGIVRDAESQGQVTRHITATLARAVRELVGSDHHRPAIAVAATFVEREPRSATLVASNDTPGATTRLLREALLALPPPAA